LKSKAKNKKQNISIAIIGLGCIFPKSSGLKEYLRLITHGEDGITDVPESHWSPNDYFDSDPKKPDHVYCKRGGFIPTIQFDPTEFGIPPNSLEATDTSQLLGLLTSKMALTDSGYGEERRFNRERTSVILGVTGTQELVIPLSSRLGFPKWLAALDAEGVPAETAQKVIDRISNAYVAWHENSFPGLLGNVVAGKICNRLDLGGTNCVVDAACASSLSAVHLAILELAFGRSDMVITGGVDTLNDIFMHMCFSKTYTLSPTGDARPFSKYADGTVLGEGIGLLVLKRLKDAEKDGDKIYAVIRAVGSSSDGKSQSIYAPRVEGQAKALRMAYETAGIDPATIELVEAHGTGTKVGDLVEFKALCQVFGKEKTSEPWCAIGSVKSMIGHTKAAAGAAGLIKTALSLYHKVLPPTLKVEEPDPKLAMHESPFYLNTEKRPWLTRRNHPRRAGVSAFGFGGSNFHMVMEEYQPDKKEISWDGSVEIIGLSAASEEQLAAQLDTFKKGFQGNISNSEISHRAAESRQAFSHQDPYRLLFVIDHQLIQSGKLYDHLTQAWHTLKSSENGKTLKVTNMFYGRAEKIGKLALLFPGQGSQYPGMGRDFVCCFPEASSVCEKANQKFGKPNFLSDFIYPRPAQTKIEKKHWTETLTKTEIAQPAIAAISLSMLKILQRFGIRPDATCGHSFGELTALHAAGWIDEDSYLQLSITRGKLMAAAGRDNGQKKGCMLAVKAPLSKIEALIQAHGLDVVLANRNSPQQGVLSGPNDAVAKANEICKQMKFRTFELPVSAAFHSPLVKNASKPFFQALKKIQFTPSKIPVFSNTSGQPYPSDVDKARHLLGEQILHPVEFVNDIESLYQSGIRIFVEVGPKTVLTGLVKSILKGRIFEAISMDSSSGNRFGIVDLAASLCHLAAIGYPVELHKWEKPLKIIRKQIMSIPISGANYRNPEDEKDPKMPLNKCSVGTYADKTNRFPNKPKSTPHNSVLHVAEDNGKTKIMDKLEPKSNNPDSVFNALSAVQEGLKSMQALQLKTAEAHQKFLETQTEASRTLQAMVESTQRLAEIAMGLSTAEDSRQGPKKKNEMNAVASATATRKLACEKHQSEPTASTDLQNQFPSNSFRQQLETTLLEVVSQLTGYPIEMLGLEMDIEADLGIDSIKRVEILSVLEEKISSLPELSPDLMGSLKTLGQFLDYFVEQSKVDETHSSQTQPFKKNALVSTEFTATGKSDTRLKGLFKNLLEVVSQLTGYPTEMLGPDMDIEADLGIDSIKRVEILSALEEKIPDLPTISPDIMGSLKTLGQITEYFVGASAEKDTSSNQDEPAAKRIEDPVKNEQLSAEHAPDDANVFGRVHRHIVSIVEKPHRNGNEIQIPSGRNIYITDDATGLAEAIADELALRDINSVRISHDTLNHKDKLANAAGLLIIHNHEAQTKTTDLIDDFKLTRHVALDLLDAADKGGAVFATITRLDGAFGFKGKDIPNPLQGALAGLAKTAAIEWEAVHCRALDITPDWQKNHEIANKVVTELLSYDPSQPIEIGLDSDARFALELKTAPLPHEVEININLDPADVVVITGGARGVTAAATSALATHTQSTLVLLGRSPYPQPEPPWLAGIENEADMKKAILEFEFGNKAVSPKKLEHSYKKYLADREVSSTLDKLKSTGSTVHYFSVDIRNSHAVDKILAEIRATHGPIKAIIHGAGVIEDRLIIDKTPKQFEKVFDTKVKGLESLLAATQEDNLKYLVLFSSITARIGNRGQSDYAMANEAINKIAQQESIQRPDCKVVSINWGPWDGGMVTPALKREFKRNGVDLIPRHQGAKCMLYEMMGPKNSPVEIVIGSHRLSQSAIKCFESPLSSQKQKPFKRKNEQLFLTFKREIDVNRYPILGSHILGGKPVVPFALMTEWFGHSALHNNPGLFFHGLNDMRILNGIKLDQKKRIIRLLAGKARKKASVYEVQVELRDGFQDEAEVIHSTARAILADALTSPPKFNDSALHGAKAYPKSIEEIYEKILFHGSGLRGIKEILNCSDHGMVARVSSAPSPTEWLKEPLRNQWLADPLVLDSAFQMATIWCYDEMGAVSLPSYCATYRQYYIKFPAQGVKAVLEVKQTNNRKMKGDFTFLDEENTVIATLAGYEAVMDPSLFKAFKP
jgi:acyl transferase domain-containing protein/NAD(P)-dependent dehydrogenase (short-subunit alcohol dehydrogenase family)